jgi:hypothetical protein
MMTPSLCRKAAGLCSTVTPLLTISFASLAYVSSVGEERRSASIESISQVATKATKAKEAQRQQLTQICDVSEVRHKSGAAR